jgi:UDP-perosamine 4-acetyltransferase
MDYEQIVIVGASGHGKVVTDICHCAGLVVAGFVDDDPTKVGRRVCGLPILGDDSWLAEAATRLPLAVALGIGDNAIRQRVAERCERYGTKLLTAIHPSATISRSARLGKGTVVMAGAAINPDSEIGEGAIINTGVVVEHDNYIGDYAHLSANSATGGNVTIGSRSHLGLCSCVLPNLRVGDDCTIGAGAVVIRNVLDGRTMVGVPARRVS